MYHNDLWWPAQDDMGSLKESVFWPVPVNCHQGMLAGKPAVRSECERTVARPAVLVDTSGMRTHGNANSV